MKPYTSVTCGCPFFNPYKVEIKAADLGYIKIINLVHLHCNFHSNILHKTSQFLKFMLKYMTTGSNLCSHFIKYVHTLYMYMNF